MVESYKILLSFILIALFQGNLVFTASATSQMVKVQSVRMVTSGEKNHFFWILRDQCLE